MNKSRLLIFSFCFFLFNNLSAQDVHFSQNVRSPLMTNPALASSADYKFRFVMNYRNQWRSVANPFKTMAASYDMNVTKSSAAKGFLGAGISFYSDKAGDSQMGLTRADLTLSYKAILNKQNILSAGVQGGFGQHSVNAIKLQWGNQYNGEAYDPSISADEDVLGSRTFGDVSGGLSWAFKPQRDLSGNAGVALFHINKPDYSFFGSGSEKLHRKFVAHADAVLKVKNTNYSFAPDFFYARQGRAQELTLGTLMRITQKEASKYTGFVRETLFWYGVHYRVGDAFIFSFEFSQYYFSIRLSYDVNVSHLSHASAYRGGYEVSIKVLNPESFYYKKSKAKIDSN